MRTFTSDMSTARRNVEPRPAALCSAVILALLGGVLLLAAGAPAAETWIDISTPLIEKLKSQGEKLAWPGGARASSRIAWPA